MTDNAQSIPSAAVNLRDQSDALLKRCGCMQGVHRQWFTPEGVEVGDDRNNRPHPYANAQDAIDLAEAMGLRVALIDTSEQGFQCTLCADPEYFEGPWQHTIAEAICAAITDALGNGDGPPRF